MKAVAEYKRVHPDAGQTGKNAKAVSLILESGVSTRKTVCAQAKAGREHTTADGDKTRQELELLRADVMLMVDPVERKRRSEKAKHMGQLAASARMLLKAATVAIDRERKALAKVRSKPSPAQKAQFQAESQSAQSTAAGACDAFVQAYPHEVELICNLQSLAVGAGVTISLPSSASSRDAGAAVGVAAGA